jgi:hypothetical protein
MTTTPDDRSPSMTIRRARTAILATALALALPACGTDDTAESSAQYCASSAATQAELAELKDMVTGGTATRDEVQRQVDSVVATAKDLVLDAADLAESTRAEVREAREAFDAAVAAIPEGAPLTDVAAGYRTAIEAWDAATSSIRSEVGCP